MIGLLLTQGKIIEKQEMRLPVVLAGITQVVALIKSQSFTLLTLAHPDQVIMSVITVAADELLIA
ncbi:hypothetical protein D3C76_1096890 [compost metagenome]